MMTNYTLTELIEYRKKLESSLIADSKEIFYNDSFLHAILVHTALLKKAQKTEDKRVDMFCGSFSIFRDQTAEKVEAYKNSVFPTDDQQQDLVSQWYEFNPYEDLLFELETFWKEGGKMHLIVENDITSIKDEMVWKRILPYYKQRQFIISNFGHSLGINHFVVTGNSYRRENSDDQKKAFCCFNDPETSGILRDNFKGIYQLSKSLSIA